MASSPVSSQPFTHSPPAQPARPLDLSFLPPVFLSATHLDTDSLHELEERLVEHSAPLTYDIHEARIVLSKVGSKRRAALDLRGLAVYTEDVTTTAIAKAKSDKTDGGEEKERKSKRRRIESRERSGKAEQDALVIDESSTESEAGDYPSGQLERASRKDSLTRSSPAEPARSSPRDHDMHLKEWPNGHVRVLNIDWFEDSVRAGTAQPILNYLTYAGKIIKKSEAFQTPAPLEVSSAKPQATHTPASHSVLASRPHTDQHILERAKADAAATQSRSKVNYGSSSSHGARRFGYQKPTSSGHAFDRGAQSNSQYAHLLHQTTSEHDDGYSTELPEMPDWVKQGLKYSCQRVTLATNPNDAFLALLKKIKLARLLTNDEIGVRAYSTSIASIAAYPYKISNPREILALPGCDVKIANLFVEYANTGHVRAAEDAENDEELKVLRLFYEIWGVGAQTARDFYHTRGWRDLDDIIEYGWSSLSRVQQIGVKFYDEFLDPIPRSEVERIAATVHRHTAKVRDEGVQSLVVGGYRRGKEACGDVDVIVSHPDEKQTLHIVNDIVSSLEDEGWVTHTLLLSLHSTNRNQQTLPYRSSSSSSTGGHGFDTLDKALVVWQDPAWPDKAADLARNPKAKNPNIHRRVDIIVAPWRTVGCAVAGWTSGTTFQRDLRRYAKSVKGWKFDSSGVRDRANGEVVDLEG
ncbi:hypothetical protein LTR28_004679, partial [Elasticomyces elasticus]